ncbi:MAG TPA: alpha/beta hydrolase [Acidimicrobiales bacterium]|nr:alpha/beta hydrolase [Acidimicrobiales bacterium]
MNIERLEIDANGLTFTARAAGPHDGRPVLLLHGFPETSWCWRRQLADLGAAGYRAVAPDQRGYSPKARPDGVEAYRMTHLVDDVLAIADTMEMRAFDLVGHDWGGYVSWVVGARHPDHVRSLSIVSAPHPGALRKVREAGDQEQAEASRYVEVFQQQPKAEDLLLGEDGSGSGLTRMFETSGLDPSLTDEYLACLTQPGAMTAALNWYRALRDEDVDDLPPIVVPTLYVWSTGDPALRRAAAEATAERVAGRYQFVVLEGVNHWIPEVAPEQLSLLLLDHLPSI